MKNRISIKHIVGVSFLGVLTFFSWNSMLEDEARVQESVPQSIDGETEDTELKTLQEGTESEISLEKSQDSTSQEGGELKGVDSAHHPMVTSAGMHVVDPNVAATSKSKKIVEIARLAALTLGGTTLSKKAANAGVASGGTKETERSLAGEEQKEPEVAKAEPSCESFTFESKDKVQRFEKNQISLKDLLAGKSVQWNSVCVRADGTPIKYQLDKKNLLVTLGHLNNPKAEITVSYCRAPFTCQEKCVVPKDDFMEAMAGLSEEDMSGHQGWGPENGFGAEMISEQETALDKELASFQKAFEDIKPKGVNQNWKLDSRKEACQQKIAKN